jgi:hypothetical protein
MPRYPLSGITSLSQLTIDADKDWNLKGISDIKEIVLGMTTGDIAYHNGTKLVKISVGPLSSELITKGPALPPVWGWVA